MNQQIEYFKQAEFALAAYGNFASNIPTLRELEAADFSPSQARAFANTYRVITQYGDATGLSATIFADNVTGDTFLAIRGTEITDPGDIFAGVSLATFGTTALQPQYASLKTQVETWLRDGILPPAFTVTGHSLGGFLATGLVNDPAFVNNITHAYLYNAPGMGGIIGSFVDTLLGFMGLSASGDTSKISNIKAAAGANPVAGLGFDAAPPIDIIIEDQNNISGSPPSKNHSQQALTDAFGTAKGSISRSDTPEEACCMKTFLTFLLILPLVTACAGPSKGQLDDEVRRLCAIDGGIKVYETVKLPAEKFDQYGQIRVPAKWLAKPEDEYFYESSQSYLVKGNPDMYQLNTKVYRSSGNQLLGEVISYARRGGDMPGPWHGSSFGCPEEADLNDLLKQIFIK